MSGAKRCHGTEFHRLDRGFSGLTEDEIAIVEGRAK